METKHTKGIWEINPITSYSVQTKSGRQIATTAVYSNNTDNGESDLENIANAKLIAATPELLKALEDFLLMHGSVIIDNGGMPHIIQAINAINKATK